MSDENDPNQQGDAEGERPTEERQPEPGRELAPRAKTQIAVQEELGYVAPTNIDEAYRYAQAVVTARLAPDSYNNDPSKVMVGILAALEAGLPPMYGLRNIAIINNRPTIWGDAARALVQKTGLLVNHEVAEIGGDFDRNAVPREQWPDTFGVHVRLWRKGQDNPYEGIFTVGDARRAKLWMDARRKPWFEHPVRMLTNRAWAIPLRDGFADALAGLAIREEVEDYATERKPAADTSFLEDRPAPVDGGSLDAATIKPEDL